MRYSKGMEMTHTDTVLASTIEVGDNIEVWDDVVERYVIETVTNVEDIGEYMEVSTEENPDGWHILADSEVRLFMTL